jgi:Undecaprenyl-phosphate galactose phosphotransferase WbaP
MSADHGVSKPATSRTGRSKVKTATLPFSAGHEEFRAIDTRLLRMRNHRHRMWLLMIGADLLGFVLAISGILLLNLFFHFFTPNLDDFKYLVVLLLCMSFFVSSRLHPGVGINPADEIRLVTQCISLSILISLAIFTVFQIGWVANALVFALAWVGSIFVVLGSRWAVRIIAARLDLWGEPVIVAGEDPGVKEIVKFFKRRRRLGFVPVGVIVRNGTLNSVPTISFAKLQTLPDDYYRKLGISTIMVSSLLFSNLNGTSAKKLYSLFQNVLFIANTDIFEGTSIRVNDFEGLLGLEARQNSLSSSSLLIKRSTDILLALIAGLFAVPICLGLAILIRLEGPGPVFYSQKRIGFGGREIRVLKFRTMVVGADQILQEYLRGNEQALDEWKRTQKLRNDPRITKAGAFLRKWSLDELPQLINVLKADLSLVGPRPIVAEELPRYGDKVDAYTKMHPGMTGLWQVSGRNNVSYEDRVKFDTFYVRNWSIWLDMYILFRTVWTLVNRSGAY